MKRSIQVTVTSKLAFLCILLGSLFATFSGWSWAQQTTAAVMGNVRLFPSVAAPGEQVWIVGAGDRIERGQLWVGGKATTFTKDPTSGWLTFFVPKDVAGGPQFIGTQGPAQQGLVLTVLPAEAAAQDVVFYVTPGNYPEVQKTFADRLKKLSAICERACPKELLVTINRLASLNLPPAQPLTSAGNGAVGGKATATVQQLRPVVASNLSNLNVRDLIRPINVDVLGATRKNSFCDQLAGILPTAGLPTGQVIALLDLLFGGDFSLDPVTFGHPDQSAAPYQNENPKDMVGKFLNSPKGSGKGVTIHIVDSAASDRDDPFVMPKVTYYFQDYLNRPGHGRIEGALARILSPAANISYKQACDKDGNCSTLRVVKALCQVAAEARRGGKHVVNLSLGGAYPVLGLQLALREIAALGVPTVASYGNEDDCQNLVKGDRCNHYPADWSRSFQFGPAVNFAKVSVRATMLYSVAAWDVKEATIARFNRGVKNPEWITPPPSVLAPGEFWFDSFPYFGSSFAAPVVSGVVANWMTCKPGVPLLMVSAPGQLPLPSSVVSACP